MVKQLNIGKNVSYSQEILLNRELQLSGKKHPRLGSVYTPPDFAHFLTSWAIRNSQDKVLDVGVGEGVFIFSSFCRLLELGAKEIEAQQQLYGSEIDIDTYKRFSTSTNFSFPNLYNDDFFKITFPLVDVVVGNPPYVRRTHIENIDQIRESVIKKSLYLKETDLNRMTDLYVYFLLHALSVLKPGGRLAVITADPWLNVGYGEGFKKYLQQHFEIESLISLDHRVFSNAEVKPVMLLARKKEKVDANWLVSFVRVKNGLPIAYLQRILDEPTVKSEGIIFSQIKSADLKSTSPWSIYFKVPELYEDLAAHRLMTSISNVAETRIGLQTLAKEFFVLKQEDIERTKIEPKFLEPLAQSLRYVNGITIDINSQPNFYLFSCSESKENLQGTYALEHINWGENIEVKVRGKDVTLVGYNNKDRIKKANRRFWYDLKTASSVRGRASILIPRLVYQKFKVIWNRARFVPGELFIEFMPRENYDDEIYLAILNSSICELLLRAHAQVYGGGTYNINPGEIKNVPIINARLLNEMQKELLKHSYLKYLADDKHDRTVIDNAIYEILEFDLYKRKKVKDVLDDLILLSSKISKIA